MKYLVFVLVIRVVAALLNREAFTKKKEKNRDIKALHPAADNLR